MEHLTAEELWEFLFHRDHKDDGLLQRFVPPRDGLNHVFRVVWSPNPNPNPGALTLTLTLTLILTLIRCGT